MHRSMLFIITIIIMFAEVAAKLPDALIVQDLLDKCGNDELTVDEVAVFENDHVVKLDISNKEISKDGVLKIPEEIGELTELEIFVCCFNSVREIPPEIGNCTKLRLLNLASNRIVAIPPEIGRLKNLQKLDLRHNSIEVLPPEIGDCLNLEYLWLWGNKLTRISPTITRLRRLKELYLNDNRLTTLPIEIIGMRFDYIDLIGNRLCNLSTILDVWVKEKDVNYKSSQMCQ